MNNKLEVVNLLHRKHDLESYLNTLIYGSIEIRDSNGKKYIYVHYRDSGRSVTKYVGEYSDDLYNLILSNTIKAKEIKKELKGIEKNLKDSGFSDNKLSDDVKKNIDFAKCRMVDAIYSQAILEGVATTFADTESIIEGGKVNNMTSNDIMKIINLKHAWEFILDENVILSKSDFSLLSQINKLVIENFYYNAGEVRSTPAKIGGTKWVPNIPIRSQVLEELNDIINNDMDDINKAIQMILYIMKRQIFIDGNKRSAVIFSNHYLISKGLGIIVIPVEMDDEFKNLLILYYENNDDKKIIKFLLEKCYIKI